MNILRFNRRNWRAVVLCIFAATIFWFLNALNKTYTTNINFPLKFEYDNVNYVPVRALPDHVRINVTGNGWDLFKRSTGVKVAALEIPLERPAEVKKIVGSNLQKFFTNQADGLEINFVLIDTLFVDLEPRAGRWINLQIDSLELNLRRGYGLASEVSIIPSDSVFIEGPQRLVTRLKEPLKLRLRQRNIDENFLEDVEVELPSAEVFRRDPPTVTVRFDVKRMVTVTDSLLLTAENIPPTVSTIQARRIPVSFSVPENLVTQFDTDSVKAILDLKNFSRGEAKLLPRIEGLPPFVKVIKMDTVRIRL